MPRRLPRKTDCIPGIADRSADSGASEEEVAGNERGEIHLDLEVGDLIAVDVTLDDGGGSRVSSSKAALSRKCSATIAWIDRIGGVAGELGLERAIDFVPVLDLADRFLAGLPARPRIIDSLKSTCYP